MAGLGGWIEGALFGAGDVMARARRLRELTGLRVMLAVRSDLYAQYLHFVEPGEPTWLSAGPGTLRSLAHSGMGWLLLSAQRDAEIRTLVRRVDYHNRTKTDLAELMNQIRKVRVDGYAVSLNQVTPGFGIMGALLPASLTTRPMAIGFGGRVEEIELRRQELRYHLFAAVAEG
jgi:DNA-binding IclR family transcriptional regulator